MSEARLPQRQRGWIGIVVILLALAIVAILAKDAFKAYGLGSGGASATSKAATVTTAPLERARGVEDMVKQQAAERSARPDGTTQ